MASACGPHESDHLWVSAVDVKVCLDCGEEKPIRAIDTVETKGGFL